MWRRWIIRIFALVLYLAFFMAGAVLLFGLLIDGFNGLGDAIELIVSPREWDPVLAVWLGGPVLVLVTSQWLFLVPACLKRPELGQQSRSLTLSILAVAVVVAALTVGLVYGVGEGIVYLTGESGVIGSFAPDNGDPVWRQIVGWSLMPFVLWPLSWLFWTPILMVFARRRVGHGRWGRLIGLLLGGTILELLIIIPLDVMVRRRTDCYSYSGTLIGLMCSAFALVWLAGPGIVIPLTSRRRRLWAESYCMNCGYAKGPSPGDRCPECGHAWKVG
ncbi:MAG: hypothetical protein SYC29_02495 [Planctomycetota bacterium]|nr:hypothetical protein [Planctomycetota bacterium]